MIEQIANFLRDRPAISVSQIEREADLPRNTIQNYMNGARETWPMRHTWPLTIVLCRYGFKVKGWRFSYDEAIDTFFIERQLDKEAEVIEHEQDGRSWFEYKVSFTRHLISDPMDLIEFFN